MARRAAVAVPSRGDPAKVRGGPVPRLRRREPKATPLGSPLGMKGKAEDGTLLPRCAARRFVVDAAHRSGRQGYSPKNDKAVFWVPSLTSSRRTARRGHRRAAPLGMKGSYLPVLPQQEHPEGSSVAVSRRRMVSISPAQHRPFGFSFLHWFPVQAPVAF